MQTHESYIAAVAELVKARATPEEREAIDAVKLAYGAGPNGTRGVTYYNRWQNGHPEPVPFVEICASCERDWVQLAGTTVHELAHVIAGFNAGHGKDWKAACHHLGLRRCHAAGQSYSLAAFTPDLRFAIASLEKPQDGAPVPLLGGDGLRPKPCGAGIGTRGGKSRGKGSGSRLIKVSCPDCGYIARVSRLWLDKSGAPVCPQHDVMVEG